MNQKESAPMNNYSRDNQRQQSAGREHTRNQAQKTIVKNSNAAGQGSIGRSDQHIDEEDVSGKVY